MRIILIGYRDWALNAFSYFKDLTILQTNEDLTNFLSTINSNEDLCLIFAGWSDVIKLEIINKFICICLHPSDLPKYRGGSPIQHQKINGIKKTKLTAIRMNSKIDQGAIIFKTEINLDGHMKDIFLSLEKATIKTIKKIIDNPNKSFLNGRSQDDSKATFFKRRKPNESEITLNEIASLPAEKLYQKICALEDPYPNAFIKTIDNRKIFLKLVEIE